MYLRFHIWPAAPRSNQSLSPADPRYQLIRGERGWHSYTHPPPMLAFRVVSYQKNPSPGMRKIRQAKQKWLLYRRALNTRALANVHQRRSCLVATLFLGRIGFAPSRINVFFIPGALTCRSDDVGLKLCVGLKLKNKNNSQRESVQGVV